MSRSKPLIIRLNPKDNVVVALVDLEPGKAITEEGIVCLDMIPGGHKVATETIPRGAYICKYGQTIGISSKEIRPGAHVHTHNVEMSDFGREYAIGSEITQTQYMRENDCACLDGIVRPNGRVGSRNYIGILATVSCSASIARYIADAFRENALAPFPNVDG